MTSESTLHRWALLDKSGKTRNTCTTSGKANATYAFKEVRKNRAIPKGWTIVDRGPVEAKPLPTEGAIASGGIRGPISAPTPEPRAFRVGDRVRGPGFYNPELWHEGELHSMGFDGSSVINQTPGCDHADLRWVQTCHLTLLEPAPQPKAEEGKRLTTVDLAEKFTNELGEALGERTPWSDMVARVATLKAEVERLTRERDAWENASHSFAQERDDAEAKLGDIRAIMRVNDMVSAIPEDAEPWHFHGLVQTVLDR